MLNVGLTGVVRKVFDGNTDATLVPANYALFGVVGVDNVFLNDPASGSYATAAVGRGIFFEIPEDPEGQDAARRSP